MDQGRLRFEWLLYIALALIPFENLKIAPSTGWGAIAPVVFFLFFIINFDTYIKTKCISVFLMIVLWGTITFLYTTTLIALENGLVSVALARYVRVLGMICIGIAIYFCFKHLIGHYEKLYLARTIVIIAYSVSFIFGIIELIGIKFEVSIINEVVDFISLRSTYGEGRVQFSFTEPSFISVHLFGVLLPFYVITRDIKFLWLIILFLVVGIAGHAGVRLLVDSGLVLVVFLFYYNNFVKKPVFFLLCLIACVLIIFLGSEEFVNQRLKDILVDGIYADDSLAARFFRLNAIVNGYLDTPLRALFGYGIGQEVIPLKIGFDQALSVYLSDYMYEINYLQDVDSKVLPNVGGCFWIRIISEFGLIILFLILTKLFFIYIRLKSKLLKFTFLIVCIILVQFGSYAFYGMWIIAAYLNLTRFDKAKLN